MALFKSKTENDKIEDKKAALKRMTERYTKREPLPERAFLCSLFTGDNGTGKSGIATSYLNLLEPDEKIFYIDLEVGNYENIIEYWREAYERDQIIYETLKDLIWEEDLSKDTRKVYINYDKAMEELRRIAMWLDEYADKLKIRMVALDGLSKFKDYIEYQMKLEKNIDLAGDPSRKFWRERNKEFMETLELYKALPIDVILIGSSIFNKPPAEQNAIDRDINNMVSQKVVFEKDTSDGITQFTAQVKKSRQNSKKNESKIPFGKINPKKEEAFLDGEKVFNAIISKKDKDKSGF
jgi:tetratricopeptide (TPR) repeat protein